MSSEDTSTGLLCEICYEKYDLTIHLPRILPACGHTLCSKCIENIMESSFQPSFLCPFDQKEISFHSHSLNDFPPNFQLRNLIEVFRSKSHCQQHQKPLDYICLVHDVRICGDCAVLGSHKDLKTHNVRAITDIEPLFLDKRDYLESIKAEILSYNPDLESLKNILEEQKGEAREMVMKNFRGVRLFIDEEEKKQLQYVDDFFEKQVQETEERDQEYQEMKRDIEEKVSQYYKINAIENPLQVLKEEIWQFTAKFQGFKETFNDKAYEAFYQGLSRQLFLTLESFAKGICSLKVQTENVFEMFSDLKRSSQAEHVLFRDFELLPLNSSISRSNSQVLPELGIVKRIKEITFSSDNQQLLNPEEVSRFKRVRISLSNIERIYACLNHPPELDQEKQTMAKELIQSLFWQPFMLRTIYLDLPSIAISDQTILFLARKVFPKTLNIQDLRLIFHRNKIHAQTLKTLIESLAPLSTNLTCLELDFSKLVCENVQSFPNIEFMMPKLKNFYLNLANRNVGDDWLRVFIKETLESLGEVEVFQLDLRNTTVTYKGVDELLRAILHGNVKFKELTLGLPGKNVAEDLVESFKKGYEKKVKGVKKLKIIVENKIK